VILAALRRTAVKWLLIAVAFIALLSAVNYGLSFVPFTPQFNSKRAVAKVETLEAQVSTLEREATGNAEIGQAVERHYEREVIIREGTAQAIADARRAPDADTPLSDERADRLRSHDLRLCNQFAGLCQPDADPAGGRAGAVPASDPS
jgi:hypothetical protein